MSLWSAGAAKTEIGNSELRLCDETRAFRPKIAESYEAILDDAWFGLGERRVARYASEAVTKFVLTKPYRGRKRPPREPAPDADQTANARLERVHLLVSTNSRRRRPISLPKLKVLDG